MRWPVLIAMAVLVAAATLARAQMLTLGVGPTDAGTVAPSTCGTGVVDASAGCPLPMLGS